MKKIFSSLIWMAMFMPLISFSSYAGIEKTSLRHAKATVGYSTAVRKDLISLPAPKREVVVAVYKFRDQTGQYKSSITGTTFSTAVTQGATSMLVKALEDFKWFILIERELLPNLLNERKIVRSTRMQYQAQGDEGEELPPLPPLLYAGVILEGGVIAYETNLVTGGFGARYFGLGSFTQIRRDQVTVYLRAVSVKNGKVLKSVSATKSIFSKEVNLGLYRFVRFKRLLEAETGFSTNEPLQMCVLEAIEKAVFDLIVEGILEGIWNLKDPADINSPVIRNYFKEKEESERIVAFQDFYPTNAGRLGLGLNAAVQYYMGDYSSSSEVKPASDLLIRCGITPHFSLMLNGGIGKLADRDHFNTTVVHSEIKGLFTLFPESRMTPYFLLGGCAFNYWVRDKEGNPIKRNRKKYWGWEPAFVSGIGVEYFVREGLSLHATLNSYFTLKDDLDGVRGGTADDSFRNLGVGFTYYLGR